MEFTLGNNKKIKQMKEKKQEMIDKGHKHFSK